MGKESGKIYRSMQVLLRERIIFFILDKYGIKFSVSDRRCVMCI